MSRRTYGDRCGVARALDLVGERWALLIVRDLLLGPKRFTDLRAGLPNVSPDVLSQRLRELEDAGLVRRRALPPPAASRVYELTDRGLDLEPVVLALGRWGSTVPFPPGDPEIGVDATIIAMRTLFDPAAADGVGATFELRLDEQPFGARVEAGELELRRGGAADPEAVIEADPATLSEILWHGRPLGEAVDAKAVTVEGDVRALRRFLRLFPLPSSAA
jgi:DNA-binding HxlR family transcriptional regulator